MKKIKIAFAFASFIAFTSCNEKTKKDYHAEHDNFKIEIEQMKIKLEATEAQLLNVSAELSELRNELKTDTIVTRAK
jgi:hypothetical protein